MQGQFVEWLIAELHERGWSNSELARRAGFTSALVSMVINGQSQPGLEFCKGVAKAFDMAPETVMRLAGLLPHKNTREELAEEILHHYDRMSPERQKILRDIARSLDREG